MPQKKITYLIVFLVLFTKTNGQFYNNHNLKLKNYTTQNGLVHDYTKKCKKDSKGFLWIITQHGLSRFDGVVFTNFIHNITDSNSLPANDLVDIDIDNNDNVWLAYATGICYYNQRTHNFIKPTTQLDVAAYSLVFDRLHSCIWYTTSKGGLFTIDCNTLKVSKSNLQQPFPHHATYLFIDHTYQNIYIGIERYGIYRFNTNNQQFKYIDSPLWVRSFYEDDEHNIWLSTWANNLLRYNAKDSSIQNVWQHQTISQRDRIYVGATQSKSLLGKDFIIALSIEAGIVLYNKNTYQPIEEIRYDATQKTGLLSDFSSSIYTDKDGIVWICSWHGLSKINKQEQQFESTELSFLKWEHYNLLTGIKEDKRNNNYCWLAVEGSGIAHFNKVTKQVDKWYYHNFNANGTDPFYNWRWATKFFEDSNHTIWSTVYGGLIKIENNKVDTIPIKYNNGEVMIRANMILKDNYWWIFSKAGLIHFNIKTNSYVFYNDSVNNLVGKEKIKRLHDGCFINDTTIFCSSHNGLYCFNTNTKLFTKINFSVNNISYNNAALLTIEKINNTVFIGGNDGLFAYDISTKTFTQIGLQQGIDKLDYYSLIKDNSNNLWIYTTDALFKYNTVQQNFRRFTTADGIYYNSFDPVQMFNYNNNIYIGYRMAYTKFNPLLVDVNANKPMPYITDVFINNQFQKINVDEYANAPLLLHYTQNNIAINYTAIDYTNSEKITFAHQLVGIDTGWIYNDTKRSAAYANLSGGTYLFKVKSCNSSGVWNESIATMQIKIVPPFWQTWWFKALMALAFVGIVVLIAYRRIKTIKQKEKEKTAINKMMAELEMRALRSQMNPHFIFNSLNSIQKYIWENKQEDASEYLTKFAKLMRLILHNSTQKLVQFNEELNFIELYIELEHRRCNNKFDYTIQIDRSISLHETLIPPMLLQPYIENAIWHGLLQKNDRGKLLVKAVKLNNSLLQFIIEDDGIGRTKAMEIKQQKQLKTTSYGMQITADRINITEVNGQYGTVYIEDLYNNQIATGTRITLQIPIEQFTKI